MHIFCKYLHFAILLSFILMSSAMASQSCQGPSQVTINGALGGSSNNCEFFMDLYRTQKSLPEFTCKSVLTVKSADLDTVPGIDDCIGIARSFQEGSTDATQANFVTTLTDSLDNGGHPTYVLLTDHGSKTTKGSPIQSQVSIGNDEITESEMRNMIENSRRKQCGCTTDTPDCNCNLPPLIMNFDHCYSGGMQNAFFKDGKPMDNVCGISASSPDELAYIDDNIAQSLNQLKQGVNGKYKSNYRKYDKNNDGKISLSELNEYHSKRAKYSLPVITSEKFMLDYFDKNFTSLKDLSIQDNTLSKENVACYQQVFAASPEFSKMADLVAELNFQEEAKRHDRRIKGLSLSLSRELDLQNTSDDDVFKLLDETRQKASDVNYLEMKLSKELGKILVDSKKEVSKIFADFIKAEQAFDLAHSDYTKAKDALCQLSEECKALKEKMREKESEIEREFESNNRSEQSLEDEFLQLQKELEKFFQSQISSATCTGKCNAYKEANVALKKASDELESHADIKDGQASSVQDLFKQVAKKLDSVNKRDPSHSFESVIEEFKGKYLGSQNIQNIKDLYEHSGVTGVLEDLNTEINTKFENSYKGYKESINKSRKLDQAYRISIAKRHMLKTMDSETLESYNNILKCEQTTLFTYKK